MPKDEKRIFAELGSRNAFIFDFSVYKYFLSKFVKNVREVPLDPIVYRENLNTSYGFLTKNAMAKLQTMLRSEGVNEKFGHQTVQVNISTVLPMEGGHSYQIRW